MASGKEHPISVDQVLSVANQARLDFEYGNVSDDEIITAAEFFNQEYQLTSFDGGSKTARQELIQSGKYREVSGKLYSVPLQETPFPEYWCNSAVLVLAQRLVDSGAVLLGQAELIYGGCGEDEEALDPTSYYDKYHAFVGIGETALGNDTIVDITADQGESGLPSVYVGQLVAPWTRDPRIEMHGW